MIEPEIPKLRVKELRKRKGLTQLELAVRAGTQPPTISHLEHENHVPNLRLLAAIASALEVDIRDLFEEPEPVTEPPSPRSTPKTVAAHLASLEDRGVIAEHASAWAGEDSARALKRLDALREALGPHYERYKAEGGSRATGAVWGRLIVTGLYITMAHRLQEVAQHRSA